MSETPISDSTPHNVAELGMLCRSLERDLTAANTIIRQQQLLDEANLQLQERIKRLEEALDDVYHSGRVGASLLAKKAWQKAKEAKP